MYKIDEAGMKALLLDAKEKHTCFEKENGPDPDWAGWYAAYMIKVLANENWEPAKGERINHPNGNWGTEPHHFKKDEVRA